MHVADYAVLRGDSALARQTIERYMTLSGDSTSGYMKLAIPILLGTDAQAAAAIREAGKLSPTTLDMFVGTFARKHDRLDRDAALDSVFAVVSKTDRKAFQAYYAGSMGALERGNRIADDPGISASSRAIYYGHVVELWNVQPPAGVLKADVCPPTQIVCAMIVGIGFANLGRWPEHQQVMARLSDAARAAPDSMAAVRLNNAVEVLRGAGMWRRGDVAAARDLLTKYTGVGGEPGLRARIELARLEAEAKRPAAALRHFKSFENGFQRAFSLYGQAAMHEQLGEPDKAQVYWARFAKLTEKGDNLPRIAEARAALARGRRDR